MSDRYDELVGGRQQYRTPTGLIVVFDEPRRPAGQPWVTSPAGLSFPREMSPSLLDQMVVVCDEAALDLHPPATAADVRELVAPLPYAPAFVMVARIAAKLWPIRDEPWRQLELAKEIFGSSRIVQLFERFLREQHGDERRYLFHEQQLFVLQRLILESADASDETGWNAERGVELNKALVSVSSVIGDGAANIRREGRDLTDWLGFFAQNGSYNATEQPLLAYQRAWRIFVELAASEKAQQHPTYCDLDEWHRARLGCSLPELFAVAFGAAQNAQDASAPPEAHAVVAPMERYLSTTTVANHHATFTEALSAPRSWYVERFQRSRDNPLRLAWEITPFQTKPFLRLPDGHLCLISPRAAQSFLTDGVYYRFLDIAAKEGRRDDYTAFVGWLTEQYVYELFDQALPGRAPADGRVLPEQEYGGQKTSDVAVDYGNELVLVEVVSTRLPLGVRVEGDEHELTRYLKRAVTDKLKQLDRVINDLQSGRAHLPGVDIAAVSKVWPVLVTYGELIPSEPLWAFIEQETAGLLGQQVAQPLTLLGIDDVETLAGMLAAGDELAPLIAEKSASGYRELAWSRWVLDTRGGPPPRLPVLEQRWFGFTDALVELLKPET